MEFLDGRTGLRANQGVIVGASRKRLGVPYWVRVEFTSRWRPEASVSSKVIVTHKLQLRRVFPSLKL